MDMAVKKVPYAFGGRAFEGALVYPDEVGEKRPAILMQPDWFGVCDHAIDMAREVAGTDYVVMLADMFGVGYAEKEKSFDDLMKISREVRGDLEFLLGCAGAAEKALGAEADRLGLIDVSRKGAIGYCIGGGFALEQARAGADFKGVVVFHATLPGPVDADAKPNIKGRVLALHGSADTVTPKEQMDALQAELSEADVDWQVMMFGHANHGFCDLGSAGPPMRYDEKLCKQSYRMMRDFFAETW
jgi:dienelactone hydrolase